MDRRTVVGSLAIGTLVVIGAVRAQGRKVSRIGDLGNSATAGMIGPQLRLLASV